MKKIGCASIFAILIVLYVLGTIFKVDLNDEHAVVKNMQGTWVGDDHEGGMYTHYKLIINGTSFKGWMEPALTSDRPNFDSSPHVEGTFTLSPVQSYSNSPSKYRNINFTMQGGGLGNNSLSARSLTRMIIYDELSGLYIVGWQKMIRVGGGGTWHGWLIIIGVLIVLFFVAKAKLFGEKKAVTQTEIKRPPLDDQQSIIGSESTKQQIFNSQTNVSQSVQDLLKMKELLDSGAITQTEFAEMKRHILGVKTSQDSEPEKINEDVPTLKQVHSESKGKSEIKKKKNTLMLKYLFIGGAILLLVFTGFYVLTKINQDISDPLEVRSDEPKQPESEKIENFNASSKLNKDRVLSESNYQGFLKTSTGERYRKLILQIPNHDEEVTTSEIEINGPVEGLYVNNVDGKQKSIRIGYEGDRIYVSHWSDTQDPVKTKAYISSKGFLSFEGSEFSFDQFGEEVNNVTELELHDRGTSEVFTWTTE